MKTIDIIFIIAIGLIVAQFVMLNIFIHKYKKTIQLYEEYCTHSDVYKDVMAEYCLHNIHNKYIAEENYAEAEKCRHLLEDIRKRQSNKNKK